MTEDRGFPLPDAAEGAPGKCRRLSAAVSGLCLAAAAAVFCAAPVQAAGACGGYGLSQAEIFRTLVQPRIEREAALVGTRAASDAASACADIIRRASAVEVRIGGIAVPSFSLDGLLAQLDEGAARAVNGMCRYAYASGEAAVAERMSAVRRVWDELFSELSVSAPQVLLGASFPVLQPVPLPDAAAVAARLSAVSALH